MDEKNIIKYINELLFNHDCVIIPGFGAFIADYENAKINTTQHLFFPPSKKIAFNANIIKNDGLLAHYISEKTFVSFNEANELIKNFSTKCLSDLNNDKHLEWLNIGEFSLNSEGSIQFSPDNKVNFLTDSFGFTSFVSLPVKRETVIKQPTKIHVDRKIIKEENTKKIPLSIKRATWITLPVLLLMIWGTFNHRVMNNIYVNYSDVVSSFISEANQLTTQFKSQAYDYSKKLFPAKKIESKKSISIKNKLLSTPAKPAIDTVLSKIILKEKTIPITTDNTTIIKNEKHFYIIGGVFSEKNNAENFISNMNQKGYHAQIIDQTKSGNYRVSIAVGADQPDASKQLQNIRNEGYSAWILAN